MVISSLGGINPATPSEPAAPQREVSSNSQTSPSTAASSRLGEVSSLYDILTDDEKAFFDSQANLGPLTYGPSKQQSAGPPAPTGQRIDVRA